MRTSSNRTGHRWSPLTKDSDPELWYLWSSPEQTVEQTTETPVIWDAIALIMASMQCIITYACPPKPHGGAVQPCMMSPRWVMVVVQLAMTSSQYTSLDPQSNRRPNNSPKLKSVTNGVDVIGGIKVNMNTSGPVFYICSLWTCNLSIYPITNAY